VQGLVTEHLRLATELLRRSPLRRCVPTWPRSPARRLWRPASSAATSGGFRLPGPTTAWRVSSPRRRAIRSSEPSLSAASAAIC
jgi:hypothetical protein